MSIDIKWLKPEMCTRCQAPFLKFHRSIYCSAGLKDYFHYVQMAVGSLSENMKGKVSPRLRRNKYSQFRMIFHVNSLHLTFSGDTCHMVYMYN